MLCSTAEASSSACLTHGHYNYYAVPDNSAALTAYRKGLIRHWLKTLRRRSQRTTVTWERMWRLADQWLPQPRILHPWPEQRFAAITQGRPRRAGRAGPAGR